MAMELLRLDIDLSLQGTELLSVMAIEISQLGLKVLLLSQQLLHLAFKSYDPVRKIVFHGHVDLGHDSCLDTLLQLMNPIGDI